MVLFLVFITFLTPPPLSRGISFIYNKKRIKILKVHYSECFMAQFYLLFVPLNKKLWFTIIHAPADGDRSRCSFYSSYLPKYQHKYEIVGGDFNHVEDVKHDRSGYPVREHLLSLRRAFHKWKFKHKYKDCNDQPNIFTHSVSRTGSPEQI